MAIQAIQPLSINKLPQMSSPSKLPRPLTEIPATEQRRNSPSYDQATKKMIVSRDSSPFDHPPLRAAQPFWQKDCAASPSRFAASRSPVRDQSPLPVSAKRSSIENLKKASRVANSPMFARETKDKYDPPSSPLIERPLTDRPLSDRIQQNPFTRLDGAQNENLPFHTAHHRPGHRRAQSKTDNCEPHTSHSPPGVLRPVKSVTFEHAPLVHQYEQQTPEPGSLRTASIASSDEEGQDSDQDTNDDADDTFDDSLEDITKTPVVMPGEWTSTSPDNARTDLIDSHDDVFEPSDRSESVASDQSLRPLPALPNPASMTTSSSEPVEHDQLTELPDFDYAPTISRESILRKVNSDRTGLGADRDSMSSASDVDYSALARVDPDVAIPSRENSTHFDQLAAAAIKEEPQDDIHLDMDAIPVLAYADADPTPDAVAHPLREASSESRYSSVHSSLEPRLSQQPPAGLGISSNEDSFSTPMEEPRVPEREMSLPLLSHQLHAGAANLGLQDWIIPAAAPEDPSRVQQITSRKEMSFTQPAPAQLRNSISPDHVNYDADSATPTPIIETPIVPERRATIKTGGKLKARPSGTPGELELMLAAKRQADSQDPVPDIPNQYLGDYHDPSDIGDNESLYSQPSTNGSNASKADSVTGFAGKRVTSQNLKLDLNLSRSVSGTLLEPGLSEEMDRLIEGQKKGYMTRQNTKVVVASSRNISGQHAPDSAEGRSSVNAAHAPSTARKPSGGDKFISTEPWVGKARRRSSRYSAGPKRSNAGPAPPLSGQESALDVVDEMLNQEDDNDDDHERGRLFVKVAGLKELDMPLPYNHRMPFQLTLDNGLHCVTTADIDLAQAVSIGQEFELVVLNDLEFQLTLTTAVPAAPKPVPSTLSGISTTSKASRSPTKAMFSRLLSSPKKRAETERRERQEAEEQERQRQEVEDKRRMAAARDAPYQVLRELVDARTGSFARSYISLKSHEKYCYGRHLTVDVPLYNEWALEQDASVVSSVRSKRSQGALGMRDGAIRRPPYVIGKLELQLMYVPRPKTAADTDMPKSMSSAIREMAAVKSAQESTHEGCLSQEGGDCPFWRRRFFRLQGSKLIAYHEHTRQPRATINLAKATRLIDDKTSLVADPKGGADAKKRRKSAFAEEDEGYQFVEEGFRIRFANGETIDFYADTAAHKDAWMEALATCIGKQTPQTSGTWTDLVLAHEKATGSPSEAKSASDDKAVNPSITVEAPSRNSSGAMSTAMSTKSDPSGPAQIRSGTPPLGPRTGHRDRKAVKSMIY